MCEVLWGCMNGRFVRKLASPGRMARIFFERIEKMPSRKPSFPLLLTMASVTVRRLLNTWTSKAKSAAVAPLASAAAPSALAAIPVRSFSAEAHHSSRAKNVGILAMETYVSGRYVDQEALEKFDGVSSGKYQVGE